MTTNVYVPRDTTANAKGANKVAEQLTGRAAMVRVVELPGLDDKGDVSDWMDNGGTKAGLLTLAESAANWQAQPAPKATATVTIEMDRDDDITAAERFISQHGENVRYCHEWGKWLIWDVQ